MLQFNISVTPRHYLKPSLRISINYIYLNNKLTLLLIDCVR